MTDGPFQDSVAIDTNVLEHLLNPEENTDFHINELLGNLLIQGIALIVDKRGRIRDEYQNRIEPRLRLADDTRNEIQLLRYWTQLAPHCEVQVSGNDELMNAIKGVITEQAAGVDRIFVYVAFKVGRAFITNDKKNIVIGPVREGGELSRAHRLVRKTRHLRPQGADVLTSQDAYAKMGGQ